MIRLHLIPKRVQFFGAHSLSLGSSIHHYRPVDPNLKIKVVLWPWRVTLFNLCVSVLSPCRSARADVTARELGIWAKKTDVRSVLASE
jgi:hypothetical protein